MQRVAIYARHSSDKQEGSTQDQINRCRLWCEVKKYNVIDVFADEARSGSSFINRSGIRDLIDAATIHNFDLIITEDLSRLSRDQEDIASFFKKMRYLDVDIETITEGIINELHIGLKGTMNALYLKDLGDKTKRGMIASAKKGHVQGGKLYGYDFIMSSDGEFRKAGLRKINPSEAHVIKHIFKRYLAGQTLQDICNYLNDMNIASPQGKKWNPTTLCGTASRQSGLLRQTIYKGVITFNKQSYKNHPETGKRVAITNPQSEWIHVPNDSLAILKPEVFDEVQNCLNDRSNKRRYKSQTARLKTQQDIYSEDYKRRRKKHHAKKLRDVKIYLTTGLLHCKACNVPMISLRAGLFGCPDKTCLTRNIQRDLINQQISLEFERFNIEKLREFTNTSPKTIAKLNSKINHAKTCRREKRMEIETIAHQMKDRKVGETLLNILDRLELECHKYSVKIDQLEERLTSFLPLSEETIQYCITGYRKAISDYSADPTAPFLVRPLRATLNRISLRRFKNKRLRAYIDYNVEKIIELHKLPAD